MCPHELLLVRPRIDNLRRSATPVSYGGFHSSLDLFERDKYKSTYMWEIAGHKNSTFRTWFIQSPALQHCN